MRYLLVLSTASSVQEARKLSSVLLERRLAACVTILRGAESHYWWQGKKEKAGETVLLIKTRRTLFTKVEKAIRENHSYSTPEVIAVPIEKGSQPYLNWLGKETR